MQRHLVIKNNPAASWQYQPILFYHRPTFKTLLKIWLFALSIV